MHRVLIPSACYHRLEISFTEIRLSKKVFVPTGSRDFRIVRNNEIIINFHVLKIPRATVVNTSRTLAGLAPMVNSNYVPRGDLLGNIKRPAVGGRNRENGNRLEIRLKLVLFRICHYN